MSFYCGPNTEMSFTGKLMGRLMKKEITVDTAYDMFIEHCVLEQPLHKRKTYMNQLSEGAKRGIRKEFENIYKNGI